MVKLSKYLNRRVFAMLSGDECKKYGNICILQKKKKFKKVTLI